MPSSKNIHAIILLTVLALSIQSCNQKAIELEIAEEKIVVEGMIESGNNPVVILTKNMSLSSDFLEIEDIARYYVSDANVRVVCDGDTTQLSLSMTDEYFPPYVYTSSEIEGVPGKTYHLIIGTPDGAHHLEATTTVPKPVILDSLRLEHIERADTLYQIRTFFHDNKQEKNYYKFFVRTTNDTKEIGEDERSQFIALQESSFLSPSLSLINDDVLGDKTEFVITRGKINSSEGDYMTYFIPNDEITLKFTQIGAAEYKIWSDIQNNISFSGMTGISSDQHISTNIIGGLGAWIGYGVSTYKISVPSSAR